MPLFLPKSSSHSPTGFRSHLAAAVGGALLTLGVAGSCQEKKADANSTLDRDGIVSLAAENTHLRDMVEAQRAELGRLTSCHDVAVHRPEIEAVFPGFYLSDNDVTRIALRLEGGCRPQTVKGGFVTFVPSAVCNEGIRLDNEPTKDFYDKESEGMEEGIKTVLHLSEDRQYPDVIPSISIESMQEEIGVPGFEGDLARILTELTDSIAAYQSTPDDFYVRCRMMDLVDQLHKSPNANLLLEAVYERGQLVLLRAFLDAVENDGVPLAEHGIVIQCPGASEEDFMMVGGCFDSHAKPKPMRTGKNGERHCD